MGDEYGSAEAMEKAKRERFESMFDVDGFMPNLAGIALKNQVSDRHRRPLGAQSEHLRGFISAKATKEGRSLQLISSNRFGLAGARARAGGGGGGGARAARRAALRAASRRAPALVGLGRGGRAPAARLFAEPPGGRARGCRGRDGAVGPPPAAGHGREPLVRAERPDVLDGVAKSVPARSPAAEAREHVRRDRAARRGGARRRERRC